MRTIETTGAGELARRTGTKENLDTAEREAAGQIGRSWLFTELPRPLLSEGNAADLSLEEARSISEQAEKFYSHDFSLFAKSDLFYEEVEQNYLNQALGGDDHSLDAKFLVTMDRFRRVLNRNSMKLHMIYAPLLLLCCLTAAVLSMTATGQSLLPQAASLFGDGEFSAKLAQSSWLIGALSLSAFIMGLLYTWPYRVTQRNNLFGLDNYITSKFSRINQQFQVAKRQALNVERNMRMSDAARLKEEAGIWTVTYQWFAMRLLLCELTVRNKIYQVRRNTTLYGIGGGLICLLLGGGVITATYLSGITGLSFVSLTLKLGLLTGLFIIVAFLVITRNATRDILRTLQTREWNRFHLIDLHQTIAEHVGEDKLQIVTFRDRNRME